MALRIKRNVTRLKAIRASALPRANIQWETDAFHRKLIPELSLRFNAADEAELCFRPENYGSTPYSSIWPQFRLLGLVSNLGKRFFNGIKQCRRAARRYDKLAANSLVFVQLASIELRLRVNELRLGSAVGAAQGAPQALVEADERPPAGGCDLGQVEFERAEEALIGLVAAGNAEQ